MASRPPARPPHTTEPGVFVGREPMVASLRSALEEAAAGRGVALLLCGEPGAGKTRTARQLVRAAEALGYRVQSARCHETEGAPALWPWLRVARALLEAVGDGADLEPLLRDLLFARAPVAAEPVDSRVDAEARFRRFEALSDLLRHACRAGPLLVWIDDLHWADAVSLDCARFALRELRDAPFAFVGAYRDGGVLGAARQEALSHLLTEASVFPLPGLSQDEVSRYMSHCAGYPVSARLADEVRRHTGGNPLFVTEVVRHLEAEGRLGGPEAGGTEALGVPTSVEQLLHRQVDALAPEAAAVLRAAAVAGRELDADLLTRASRLDPRTFARACEELLRLRMISDDGAGGLAFAHDLVRECMLTGLDAAEREHLHGALARAIEDAHAGALEGWHGTLAHHYARSRAPGAGVAAAEHAERAAREAMAQGAHEVAEERFRAGLEALAREAESSASGALRARLLLGLGHALWQGGRRDAARDGYRAVLDLARERGDAVLFARAVVALAGRDDLAMDTSDETASLPLEAALESLPSDHDELRARLLASLVMTRRFAEPPGRVEAWAREAVARAGSRDDSATSFAAHESLHYALMRPEGLEERQAIAERLVELARRSGSLRLEGFAELWRVVDALEAPDGEAADAAIARLERIAERTRQPFFGWLAAGFRATRATMAGRIEEAEERAQEAFELGRRAGTPNAFAFFGTQLFHVREEQGRIDELEPVMRQLVEERPEMRVFRIGIPLIHALMDRRDEARSCYELEAERDFDDVADDLHRLPLLTSASIVCAYLRDERRARRLREALEPFAGRTLVAGIGTHWAGPIDLFLARLDRTLGDLDLACERLGRAIDLCTRGGAALMRAHALAERAAVLDERASVHGSPGDAARARQDRQVARDVYVSLGLGWRVAALASEPRPTSRPRGRFSRDDGLWALHFEGSAASLPDARGLAYLAKLLAAPGRGVHVLELVTSVEADDGSAARNEGLSVSREGLRLAALDARAVEDYRERLRRLAAEREEAERLNDLARVEALAEETAFLERELAAGLGLGGRARSAASPVERARKAVYNRIRTSIRRIQAVHPALARHLDASVRTGTRCEYRPERRIVWELD